ncbi:MAG TPA: M50 family metallopeptidase [Terracidiphilus sp.]|nr:M50 family metallopeptidase [Terracidiphilus sp.]
MRGESLLPARAYATPHPLVLTGSFRIVLSILFLIPPVFAVCFGMAAMAIRRGLPSARPWAIVASIIVLLQSLPILAIMAFAAVMEPMMRVNSIRTHPHHGSGLLLLINLVFASIGVAGLVAFGPRDSASPALAKPPRMRIAGDGTSRFADTVAWIVGTAGYIAAISWLDRYAFGEGMAYPRGLQVWTDLFLALLISTAIHEAGHALSGLALGMKLRMFLVGPFQWHVRDGRWAFAFNLKKTFSAGGATACVPARTDWSPADDICMIAAGPAASLTGGIFGAALLFGCKDAWYAPAWHFLACMTAISFTAAVVNLIPLRPDAMYSDGAQIYQLVKGGPWADLHRIRSLAASTLVTPLRPRDYDLEAIRRAEQSFTDGKEAMLLRMIESSYYLDRGQLDEARQAYKQAEALYSGAEQAVNAGFLTALVYRSAFLCRDANATRAWWNKMESAKSVYKGFNYWLAKSALSWVEGNVSEASAHLRRAEELGASLPNAGDNEFDRYRCELLRREIEASGRAPQYTGISHLLAVGDASHATTAADSAQEERSLIYQS